MDLVCAMGSIACAMSPVLSQYKFTGLHRFLIVHNPAVNFRILTASFAASEAAMYSASVVASATVGSLKLFS